MEQEIIDGIKFLEKIARDSANICLIKTGEDIGENVSGVSKNLLGIDVVTPAASKFSPQAYPSFWLRDFVMSVPADLYDADYLYKAAKLFAESQKEQDWEWYNGFVPAYTPAEHINLDGGYCYYPGSYFSDERQGSRWGPRPPMDSSFYFVHLIYYIFRKQGNEFLNEEINGISLIERAQRAFHAVETDKDTGLCKTTPRTRAVGFGFNDGTYKIGFMLFSSCLKYRAAGYLSEMLERLGEKEKSREYQLLMKNIQSNIVPVFRAKRGFLYAATEVCRQRDVWGTAFAVYSGVLTAKYKEKACIGLRDAYLDGLAVREGNVRQILVGDDWTKDSAWEYTIGAEHGNYQNGGYWLTPSGWYIYALSLIDLKCAREMFLQMVEHMKRTDFRSGGEYKGPYEWYNPTTGKFGHPVNLTSSACPLKAIRRIMKEGLWKD